MFWGLFYILENYIRFKKMILRIFQTVLDTNGKCIIPWQKPILFDKQF